MRFVARLAIAALLLAGACRPTGEGSGVGSRTGSPPKIQKDSGYDSRPPQAGFPRRVVDSSGHTIELAAPPQRIVSQTLATDELLFAMIDPVRIVGVSRLARDPAYSNVVEQASKHPAPAIESVEQVLTLRPDVVFVSSISRAELVEVLQASGAPIYRFANFDHIDDVKANIRRIGEAVGAESAAERLVRTMEARLAAIAARRARAARHPPRVVSYSPGGFTAGAGTTWDDIVHAAVAVNVASEAGLKGFPRISAEQVLAWQPDFIVVGVNPGERDGMLRQLRDNPAVAATKAMKSGRVIFMQNRALLSVSHHLLDAVEALAAALDAQPVTP